MARVEMTSPATSGTAMVPEAQVEAYRSNGWRPVKPATKSEPKPKQGKGSTKKSSK